jgi:hypothetical protein
MVSAGSSLRPTHTAWARSRVALSAGSLRGSGQADSRAFFTARMPTPYFRWRARFDRPARVAAERRVQIDLGLQQHPALLVVQRTTMVPKQTPDRSQNPATSLAWSIGCSRRQATGALTTHV